MNSPTNVVAKLNLNKYESKLILNQPEDIAYFNELQYDSEMTKEKYDLIFVFIFNMDQFKEYLDLVIRKQAIHENGYLFLPIRRKTTANTRSISTGTAFLNKTQ